MKNTLDRYHASVPNNHPQFPHEVLAVVLQVRADSLHVLLWQRAEPPFEGRWALPGGPLAEDERLGTSLGHHLAAKVDLTDIAHMEQLETRSDPARDPRGRVLATAYLALVSSGAEPHIPADTAWHPVQDLPPTAFDHGSIANPGGSGYGPSCPTPTSASPWPRRPSRSPSSGTSTQPRSGT